MDTNRFSIFIKLKRTELNLTLRKAAKLIGISPSYLSTLENGIDPRSGTPIRTSPEIIKLISDGYNTDYNYLLSLHGYLSNYNDLNNEEEKISDLELLIANFSSALCNKKSLTLDNEPVDEADLEFLMIIMKTSVESLKKTKKNKLKPIQHSKLHVIK